MLHPAKRRLQGANRAGPQGAGAGIAVEYRDTDRLGAAGENPSLLEPNQIPIYQNGGDDLHNPLEGNPPFHPIPIHSRHILTAFCMTSRCSCRASPMAIRRTDAPSRPYRRIRTALLRKADLILSSSRQHLIDCRQKYCLHVLLNTDNGVPYKIPFCVHKDRCRRIHKVPT